MSIDTENELEFDEGETGSGQPEESNTGGEPSEPTEYTPNYSYKVRDEEFEFDEGLRGAVTSKESEEALRDLYTRSAGLDGYKTKYGELEGQTNALVQGFQTIKSLRDNKDMRGLLKALDVDENTLLDYAETLLTEQELPEEQQKLLNENRQMREKMDRFESQLSGLQEQDVDRRTADQLSELEGLISSEAILPTAKAMMSVGINMQEEVVNAGRIMYQTSGTEPTVASVVRHVADKFSYLTKNQVSDKPTIPSVEGSGASSVGGKVKSIDDIRKAIAAMS